MIKKYGKIEVKGGKDFIKQTFGALDMIKSRDRTNYKKLQKYLKGIYSFRYSHINLETGIFYVGKNTAFKAGLKWFASAIVHDVAHFILDRYKNFKWKKGNYKQHEILAGKEQATCLKRLGASKKLINYVEKEAIKLEYWKTKTKDQHW